jgi:hypothetical protein
MKPQVKLEPSVAADVQVETDVVPCATVLPIEENLLELPPAKATLTKFPPGSLVLYKNDTSMDDQIKRGLVESVSIDLSPEKSSKDYFYNVSFENKTTTTIAGESQLQWAPSCPVWAKPIMRDPGFEWKSATVVGSYQDGSHSEPMYSIKVAGSGALFHGVSGDCIRYRQSESVPATFQPNITNRGASVVSPATAKPNVRYSSELHPATLVVDTDGGTEQQAPSPKKFKIAEANPKEENGTSRSSNTSQQLLKQAASFGGDRERQVQESPLTRPTNKFSSPYASLAVTQSNPKEEDGTNRSSYTSQQLMKAADSSGDRERQVQESPLTRPTINKDKNSYASLVSHVNDTVVTPLADHRMAGKDREECTFEIKIPSWANQGRIGDAIIGEGGRNHKRLLHETGASKIKLIQANRNTPLRDRRILPKVVVTIDPRYMQAAKELIEDVIVRAVPKDHQELMLYYLAKENNYGASDGPARYQRSLRGNRVWMFAIETPPCFAKYAGLFLGKRGRATREIIAKTGCYCVKVWAERNPTYVFVSAPDAEMANAATRLVNDRIEWTLEEGEKRRITSNYTL